MTIRPVRLAQVAAEAESLRLRAMISRIVTRIVLAIIALVFVLGALGWAHVALWYVLRVQADLSYLISTAILGGGDLLIAIVLLLLAGRSSPSRTEREALALRRQAIEGLRGILSITQMALPLLSVVRYMARREARRRRPGVGDPL